MNQLNSLRKLTQHDHFNCPKCQENGKNNPSCPLCEGLGLISGNSSLAQLIQEIIQKKLQPASSEDISIIPTDMQLIKPIRSERNLTIHLNYYCDICKVFPIKGTRYSCKSCEDFDLCSSCKWKKGHEHPLKAFEVQLNSEQQLMLKAREKFQKS